MTEKKTRIRKKKSYFHVDTEVKFDLMFGSVGVKVWELPLSFTLLFREAFI